MGRTARDFPSPDRDSSIDPARPLGDQIKFWRNQAGLSQKELALEAGTSAQWISAIEAGGAPSVDVVFDIHERLFDKSDPLHEAILAIWLVKWLELWAKRSQRGPGPISRSPDRLSAAMNQVASLLGVRDRLAPTTIPDLADFPAGFEPLAVICGDRREDPAETKGDIFVRQLAVTDIKYLSSLGLPQGTLVYSDKLFELRNRDFLKKTFADKHLLVIGSPAVNLAARELNECCVFRFHLPNDVAEWWDRFRSERLGKKQANLFWEISKVLEHTASRVSAPVGVELDVSKLIHNALRELLDDSSRLHNALPSTVREEFSDDGLHVPLIDLARKILTDRRGLLRPPSYWMDMFRKPGIFDPAEGVIQADKASQHENNDFGVISVGRNPFAEESSGYATILAGGIHGPGSAHAVKTLSERDFAERPLGGVIEVTVDTVNKPWGERIPGEQVWLTKPYPVEKVRANLRDREWFGKDVLNEEKRALWADLVDRWLPPETGETAPDVAADIALPRHAATK